MEPHESSSDPVKTLRPRLLFINELNCLTEVAGQFTGSPANKSRQIWDEITVQNTTLYFEFIKVFELSSFDNMTLSRSSRSSSCKTLSFKVFYYLFLSRCVCVRVFLFFFRCRTRVPETASVCTISDSVPVAGSLVTRALKLARVSLQSFSDQTDGCES